MNGVVVNRTFVEPAAVYIRLQHDGATVFKCGACGLDAPGDMGEGQLVARVFDHLKHVLCQNTLFSTSCR